MAKTIIDSKLVQTHTKTIKSLRQYKREANFINKKMNELIDEIIEALEEDAHAERKTDKEFKCDLAVEEFMDLFLEKMDGISRIPFKLVFLVYQSYCKNYGLFAYDDKKYFKHSVLEYIESRPECKWFYDDGQHRIPEKDKKQIPSMILGIRIGKMYRELDRARGVLVNANKVN